MHALTRSKKARLTTHVILGTMPSCLVGVYFHQLSNPFCPSWGYISRYHRYPEYFGTIVSIMHRYDHGVIYLDTIVTPSILELLYPLCKGMMELPILGSTKWRSMWRSWSRNTASPNSWPNGIQNLLYMEFSLACWPSDTHVACQTMQILMDSNCMHAKKGLFSCRWCFIKWWPLNI